MIPASSRDRRSRSHPPRRRAAPPPASSRSTPSRNTTPRVAISARSSRVPAPSEKPTASASALSAAETMRRMPDQCSAPRHMMQGSHEVNSVSPSPPAKPVRGKTDRDRLGMQHGISRRGRQVHANADDLTRRIISQHRPERTAAPARDIFARDRDREPHAGFVGRRRDRQRRSRQPVRQLYLCPCCHARLRAPALG